MKSTLRTLVRLFGFVGEALPKGFLIDKEMAGPGSPFARGWEADLGNSRIGNIVF
jgi:hypothetical protein